MRRKPFQRVDKASIYPSCLLLLPPSFSLRFASQAKPPPTHKKRTSQQSSVIRQTTPRSSQPPLPPQQHVRSGQVSLGLSSPPCIVPNRRNPYLHRKRPSGRRSSKRFSQENLRCRPSARKSSVPPCQLTARAPLWEGVAGWDQ